MREHFWGAASAALIALTLAGHATASETFNFTYTGIGNGAVETGWVTIDNTGLGVGMRQDPIVDISVTISGASSGNGAFGDADFLPGGFIFDWAPVALDLNKQLVGQPVGGGCSFGDLGTGPCGAGLAGDFNLVPGTSTGTTPIATFYFMQRTDNGTEDELTLTSLTVSSVPEPATWAMMLVGFAGLGLGAFRRALKMA